MRLSRGEENYFFDDFFDPLLVVFFDFLAAIDTSFLWVKD
jgi:hypothetical protein